MRTYHKQVKILAAIGICLIAAVLLTAAFTPKKEQKRFIHQNTDAVSTTVPTSVRLFPVNINTATKAQLQTVPGIGEKTAAKIIVYRETNGAFQSVEDIRHVEGIGEKMFQSIKEYICVDE